jgi:DNA invertase Pin-like site-specific DNA recombinase
MMALGYCRVSSTEQIDGSSLKSQEEQIRAYCVLKGIELAGIFVDPGISGGTPLAERPAGAEMVKNLKNGTANLVILTKLDRGFRDTVDCLQTVQLWEKSGVSLHIIDMGGSSVDTTSAAGRFMLTVLVAAAEMEKNRIRERCNEGRRARKAEGRRIGEVPFGYSLAEDGKSLMESPVEQRSLALIRSLKDQGHTLRAIADRLNALQVPTKKGRGLWSYGQVHSILKRAA